MNTVWRGIGLGLSVPLAFFLLVFLAMHFVTLDEHTQSLLFVVGVGLNLLTMRLANRNRQDQVIKGILLVSFLFAVLFFFYKAKTQF